MVRVGERDLTVFEGDEVVAIHEIVPGKGRTLTQPAHLPTRARIATQEIHRRRVRLIRAAGPNAAQYLAKLRDDACLVGDQLPKLEALIQRYGAGDVEAACARALHFGALDGAPLIERIIKTGLHRTTTPRGDREQPRDDSRDYGRPLREYDELLRLVTQTDDEGGASDGQEVA